MRPPTTVAVLMYHSVAATTTTAFANLTVDPVLFTEHMAMLREAPLDVIPFNEVPGALAAGHSAVAISIDDGLADAAGEAAPVLLALGLPATLFVPSGFVGGTSRWLREPDADRAMVSWSDLDELARAGFEIGSHGRAHLAADVNPLERVRRDAAESRVDLEDRLGIPVTSFAYPFGYHTAGARRAIREAGFAQACAVGDLAACPGDDRWALPRLAVTPETTAEALLATVSRAPSRAARAWVRAKRSAWSAGRRCGACGPPESRRGRGVLV
jgi:peptidoglycan/xylan/chitin deacetylase (PgdA/CDA1 family)